MPVIFRPYQPVDKPDCLTIFDSNTPPFFDPSERPDFESFLQRQPCPFFVLEKDQKIVACGGYGSENEAIILAWGMVHRDLHKHGLGTTLLVERIKHIRCTYPKARIIIDTSQHSQEFFRRQGFQVTGGSENYYGPGLHRVDMELILE